MDFVGKPWQEVQKQLIDKNLKYTTVTTHPSHKTKFSINKDMLYVVRQQINAEGYINLVLCAKMGKEVC